MPPGWTEGEAFWAFYDYSCGMPCLTSDLVCILWEQQPPTTCEEAHRLFCSKHVVWFVKDGSSHLFPVCSFLSIYIPNILTADTQDNVYEYTSAFQGELLLLLNLFWSKIPISLSSTFFGREPLSTVIARHGFTAIPAENGTVVLKTSHYLLASRLQGSLTLLSNSTPGECHENTFALIFLLRAALHDPGVPPSWAAIGLPVLDTLHLNPTHITTQYTVLPGISKSAKKRLESLEEMERFMRCVHQQLDNPELISLKPEQVVFNRALMLHFYKMM